MGKRFHDPVGGRVFGPPGSGQHLIMSIWSKLRSRRQAHIEQARNAAMLKAASEGATPDQVRRAGDRAASGTTNAAILGSISS
jgi:hypothetical protein